MMNSVMKNLVFSSRTITKSLPIRIWRCTYTSPLW